MFSRLLTAAGSVVLIRVFIRLLQDPHQEPFRNWRHTTAVDCELETKSGRGPHNDLPLSVFNRCDVLVMCQPKAQTLCGRISPTPTCYETYRRGASRPKTVVYGSSLRQAIHHTIIFPKTWARGVGVLSPSP